MFSDDDGISDDEGDYNDVVTSDGSKPPGVLNYRSDGVIGQQFQNRGLSVRDFFFLSAKGVIQWEDQKSRSSREKKMVNFAHKKYDLENILTKISEKIQIWRDIAYKLSKLVVNYLKEGVFGWERVEKGINGESDLKKGSMCPLSPVTNF